MEFARKSFQLWHFAHYMYHSLPSVLFHHVGQNFVGVRLSMPVEDGWRKTKDVERDLSLNFSQVLIRMKM